MKHCTFEHLTFTR